MITTGQNVFYREDDFAAVGPEWVERLKTVAATNPMRRARLCLHKTDQDNLHEMIIALARDCLFPPHRHVTKIESYHMIQGRMALIIFADDGRATHAILLTPPQQGGSICYRLGKSLFHAILPLDDVIVFHEVTNGPFIQGEAILADWAPTEQDTLRGFLKESAILGGIDASLVSSI